MLVKSTGQGPAKQLIGHFALQYWQVIMRLFGLNEVALFCKATW